LRFDNYFTVDGITLEVCKFARHRRIKSAKRGCKINQNKCSFGFTAKNCKKLQYKRKYILVVSKLALKCIWGIFVQPIF